MSVAAVTRQQYLDDVTNGVGETFLAAPLTCCRCHDHKFDPLPQREFMALLRAAWGTRLVYFDSICLSSVRVVSIKKLTSCWRLGPMRTTCQGLDRSASLAWA